VFVPDPIYAAGGTLDDSSRANEFLTGVALQGLDDPASGALVGDFANLEPAGAPVEPTRQPDGLWGGGRGDAGFEAQNAYYWIDYGQRMVQRLGFDGMLNQSFPVVPIDPDTVDNAFYSPAEGKVYLGVGSNGIHEGEDATGILHEYGHALLDAVAPNLLGRGDTAAYHEAFGDIFAVLATLEFRTGDWPCFFMWTDQACLRRMDTAKVYPDDLVQRPHTDGEIYTGAIADVGRALLDSAGIDIDTCPGTDRCNDVRDRVLTTVLASNYYLTANSSMPDIAAAYLLANDAQYGGADAELISDAFAGRGLVGGSGTVIDADGDTTGAEPEVTVEIDISHTYRGDLSVAIGVVDADFNELCTTIDVFTPDPEDDGVDLSGWLDISDTDCAPLVPPSPDQIWFMFVEDTVPDDEGEILGFAIVVGGTPYLAPGLPVPIADADPDGSAAFVDGTGEEVSQEGTEEIGSAGSGAPFATVALTHTYQGDLQIRTGVADAEGNILCSVPVLEPDPAFADSGSVDGDIDMSECGALFPPTPDQQWFLLVADTALEDTGTIDAFAVTGADGAEFVFTDLPLEVPDADPDGVVLLLDGSGGSSGQAGGGGQGADLGLPGASIAITHPFAGDLAVTGGVLDPDGNVLCEVALHTPDANEDAADLVGDVSLAECSEHYPPNPNRIWYLYVADTLSEDTGAVDAFSLTGPDGAVYTFADLPVPVPDADPDGVVLLLDGSELGVGADAEPVVSVVISHPYVGDLDVAVGVADADGEALCAVTVAEADPENGGVDLAVDVPLGDCAPFYPPAPDQQWFVVAFDNFEFDEGAIEAFGLFGPDGAVWLHPETPAIIPDADLDGLALAFDGTQPPEDPASEDPVSGDPVVSLGITHPFSGDLRITTGAAEADGTVVCEVILAEPDAGAATADVVADVTVPECADRYPPGPDSLWFLVVSDEAEEDAGSVDYFVVSGPDGQVFESTLTPVEIPDNDPEGVTLIVP
jgi:subtilisin-like proprotein convertase family protein